jgi:hypothetical protein
MHHRKYYYINLNYANSSSLSYLCYTISEISIFSYQFKFYVASDQCSVANNLNNILRVRLVQIFLADSLRRS